MDGENPAQSDGGGKGGEREGVETKQSTPTPTPQPITNAILSRAVTTAISEFDTTRAFDMMLLNEQMSVLEAENKCVKDEAAFLRESLARQTQETSAMYHYFHGKLDSTVATIARLEGDLAAASVEMERLKEDHARALASADRSWQTQLNTAAADIQRLRDELFQVTAFSQQKQHMEDLVRELQAELEAKSAQFAADKHALELKAMFEQDRVKKQLLAHVKESKQALLLRTDEQLDTTTKRTMMENDHFLNELSFQSKQTEKLLRRFQLVEQEAQRLRIANKILEENELVMAKKNNYYQKILAQLKKHGGGEPPKPVELEEAGQLSATRMDHMKNELLAKQDDELAAAQAHIRALEESLRHAQQWIRVWQHEKQFVVAQQDEIIQFLCRALRDAATDLASKPMARPVDDARLLVLSASEAAQATTTMEEFVTCVPTIALDELSTDHTRQILAFLLEKMRLYQQQVALIYRGDRHSPARPLPGKAVREGNRELLAKQLGVELPPITPPSVGVTSPLKVKRRIQPYTATTANASRPVAAANQDLVATPSKPIQLDEDGGVGSPSKLLAMATSPFNFLQATPAQIKSPASLKHVPVGSASPTKAVPKAARPHLSRSSDLADSSEIPMEPLLAAFETKPSAWSTDSLPVYDAAHCSPDPVSVKKQASGSKRRG